MRAATRIALLLAVALLGACAGPRVREAPLAAPADAARRSELQSLAGYGLRGSLAASNGTDGFSAQLAWRQSAADAHVDLRSPLGLGGASLDWQQGMLRFAGSDGRVLAGDEAEAALARTLGFAPPVASLRYWLLAVPDPAMAADEQADAAGHPARISQSGWQLSYADYQPVQGQWLPGRVTAERPPLRLKLRILHWDLP